MTHLTPLRAQDLDEYVRELDRLGGPGQGAGRAFTQSHIYQPGVAIDTTLDPFGAEYLAQQIALYEEISGRRLDQLVNEETPIDIARHAAAPNSYDHPVPAMLADHLIRLAATLRLANPARGHWLLDMGCGWGLSSEFMAQAGLNVLAMDVSRDFVALVQQRAARLGLNIRAEWGEFETYGPPHPVDLVLFYECLHHAPRPWHVLGRVASALAPHDRAQILLAGEPIQAIWWPHWGMRLDGESIYVMRKFGWFESGWSLDFILRCLALVRLEPQVETLPEPVPGLVIAARRRDVLGLEWLRALAQVRGITPDAPGLCLVADAAEIDFGPMPGQGRLVLRLRSFRGRDTAVTLARDDGLATPHTVPDGHSEWAIEGITAGTRLRIEAQAWVPAEETGSPDERRIGFHVLGFDWHHQP